MLNTLIMDLRQEVKDRLSIEDVIGSYLELRRAGRNWKAKSPFTNEKTPSFIVSPEKQIWHDFSSNKGGDVFSFVMEVEGIDFKTALELLAKKAGLDPEQFRDKPSKNFPISKERLYLANELAVKFYQVQLTKSQLALDYTLKTRSLSKETIITWRFGYSPNTGTALYKYLRSKSFSDKELRYSGLVSYKTGQFIDMFRSRLMIPLFDPQGGIVGFTARALSLNDRGPKYINTPRTLIYDKSRHVFGLNFAKSAIRQNNYVVICEGNLDVVASHQANIKQVVATAGTAITESHFKALSYLTSDIRLALDSDAAGQTATKRAIVLASNMNLNLSVIDIKNAKDPDELIRKDQTLWIKAINDAQYAVDWYIATLQQKLDISSGSGKRLFSDKILELIRNINDEVEKDHYLNKLAKLLDVSRESLTQKLKGGVIVKPKKASTINPQNISYSVADLEYKKAQDQFLSLMLERQTLRDLLNGLTKEMFNKESAILLFNIITSNLNKGVKDINPTKFKKIEDYVKIEQLLYEELYSGLDLNELHYEASRLRSKVVESFVKIQKETISRNLKDANTFEVQRLLEEAKKLDQLLNQTKGETFNYATES